ncbi:effector-associated constant component EACC1 [Nocardia fluminea]|uniref:Uncharacterized protein n=1 Tax=Nocardia fluminea TaxID=134984 RepID=A0A2N3V5B2_9NOCA|nr:hypothetical protein [Nocardia fluminea]PKV76812.1 hypothetical protein ATK86_7216 [Nocardia fluminea]
MDARIEIPGGNGEDLRALREWLSGEDELRGRVRGVRQPIGDTELGAVTDVLTVALATGGAGSVLASSLVTWLKTRQTSAKITVKSARRSVTLDIRTVEDVAPLLEQILSGSSELGDEH